MCGLTGFWQRTTELNAEALKNIVDGMSKTVIHRGPDDGGSWQDEEVGIALGHRRLAIVDLSPLGHQPMESRNGRYVIAFNGEIYNFLELRCQLESFGHKFKGNSDTEVMLAGFVEWGLEGAIKRFNGMFAFALWDSQQQVLHLGRDRLGEKPLYYGFLGKSFIFASELKALKVHPDFEMEIDRDTLALFFKYNYIPAPYSIYKRIYKLPPGTILSVKRGDTTGTPIPYWSAKNATQLGVAQPFFGCESEAIEQLEVLLQDAVKLRMVADVPLGAFLSGGIDSSTVVALMQAQSSQRVKTFSIGFSEDAYNEATYAKQVADYLGCEHTELYVTPQQALAVIPKLPTLYDEPFSDNSQIPTFLVSELAKQHVTVSLSGDGGDELFAGYNRYFLCRDLWQKIGWIPSKLRLNASRILTSRSQEAWDTGLNHLSAILPHKLAYPSPGYKLHLLADILAASDSESMYEKLVSHQGETETLVIGAKQLPFALSDRQNWSHLPNFIQRMMYLDTVTYLPDDILVKVDRASMGVSLEGRIPLLDHRVVEFASRIPLSMKIRGGESKWLLRQVLYKYVPKHLIDRPKMGFGVPIGNWLRSPLRDWAETLLDENRLETQGFLNSQLVRQKWSEHLDGNRDWKYYLWNILMFQSWLEVNS
jgi:asparagine synthase (glutamine-hydrolysing)